MHPTDADFNNTTCYKNLRSECENLRTQSELIGDPFLFSFCFQRMMRLESSRRGGAAGFSLPMPPVHHSRPRKSSTLKANV